MRARTSAAWIVAAGAVLACGGCGFKGPLYLPERNATVVTHPAQGAQGAQAPGQAPAPAAKPKSKASTAPPAGSPPPPQ